MGNIISNQGGQPPQITKYLPASEIRSQKLAQQLKGNVSTAVGQGSVDLHVAFSSNAVNLQACKQGCLLAARDVQVCSREATSAAFLLSEHGLAKEAHLF
jgi:hypothetical protein